MWVEQGNAHLPLWLSSSHTISIWQDLSLGEIIELYDRIQNFNQSTTEGEKVFPQQSWCMVLAGIEF